MIRIICVGKLKEKYLIDMVNDYKKRINKYQTMEIIEVMDSNLEEESNKIKKLLKKNSYIITSEIEGKELNSIELSEKINKLFIDGISDITFIIGGSVGLDKSIKDISDFKLSFSKFTFPHRLFRAILLEQIYRSFKILNNEKYHK